MSSSLHRYRTRVIVVVHSHLSSSAYNLSRDVIGMRYTKSVKGAGGMSLDLVPRRNFFNLIYPNDVVNVYIDPGDGNTGFVRRFMGYVDRVERTEQTDENGGVSTMFRLSCTDFQKAFERTNIYFNPHLSNRTDLIDPGLGQSLLGGHALRVRGVRAHGTPSDMVENLATMLLGFGSQWVLPKSYRSKANVVEDNQRRRRNRAKARLNSDLLRVLSELGLQLDLLVEDERDIEEVINERLIPPGVSIEGEQAATLAADGTFSTVSAKNLSILRAGILSLRSYQTTYKGSYSDTYSILDLLDLSFIEAAAIDGYISSAGIWKSQGSLISLMKAFSNEIVNELFFDLRPVSYDFTISPFGDKFLDSAFGRNYSISPDELGINIEGIEGFEASVPAIQYVPAIVLREYPFSYTEGLDLSKLHITETSSAGFVPFGPIFSQKEDVEDKNRLYRTLYNYLDVPEVEGNNRGLSPIACELEEISAPLKHLDVIRIRNTDVISSSVGRSDNDVFNYFAMYATDSLQKIYKYMLKHFLPIVTPISIARNGLRVSEVKTRFANYSRDQLCDGSSAVSSSAILKNMIRWTLLMDHWNQHNHEYLSGEIQLRGMPDLRVGYRLDWIDRKESYYVEGVSDQWSYPGEYITTVQVSRGQRNDPFPSYVPPKITISQDSRSQTLADGSVSVIDDSDPNALVPDAVSGGSSALRSSFSSVSLKGGGDRTSQGRLAKYFEVVNTSATYSSTGSSQNDQSPPDMNAYENRIDMINGFGGVSQFGGVIEYADACATREAPVNCFDPSSLDSSIGDLDE